MEWNQVKNDNNGGIGYAICPQCEKRKYWVEFNNTNINNYEICTTCAVSNREEKKNGHQQKGKTKSRNRRRIR